MLYLQCPAWSRHTAGKPNKTQICAFHPLSWRPESWRKSRYGASEDSACILTAGSSLLSCPISFPSRTWKTPTICSTASYLLFSRSLISDSLWLHGLQHSRLPCPSLSPRVCSNSRPLSRWCHPTILSSVIPFSCPQTFPAWGFFPMSWLFESGGQSTGASASALCVA